MRHPFLYSSFSLLLMVLPLRAQVGSPRTDLAFGVSGGYTFSSVDFNPSIKQDMKGGLHFGLTGRYICERYFNMICGVQGEVNFSQAGWREKIETSEDTYERTTSFVQVPLLAHLGFGRERGGAKGFLVLGPQLGYYIGESEKRTGPWTDQTLSDRPNGVVSQYDLKVEKRFEYGITAGLGLELSTKSGHRFLLEGRYYYGLADIFKNSKQDPFGRSATSTIYAKFSYLIDVKKTPSPPAPLPGRVKKDKSEKKTKRQWE